MTYYILLHELPTNIVQAVFNQAFRVVKPDGGILMSDVARYSDLNKLDEQANTMVETLFATIKGSE